MERAKSDKIKRKRAAASDRKPVWKGGCRGGTGMGTGQGRGLSGADCSVSVPPLWDFRADALQKPFARDSGPDREEEHEMCGELGVKRGERLVQQPANFNRW